MRSCKRLHPASFGKNIFKIPKNKKDEKFTPEELADVSLEEVKKWITAQDKNAFKEKPKKAAAKKPAAKKPAVKKAVKKVVKKAAAKKVAAKKKPAAKKKAPAKKAKAEE